VLLGNELNTNASWRWVYYITIIFSTICLVGTTIFYFPPSRPQADYEKNRWQELRELDYVGIALYTGSLVAFLVGITWAGSTEHPWSSASVITPIVIGAIGMIACFAYDFSFAKRPFFPFRLFAQVREFTVLLILVFVTGMVFISMQALLPQGSLFLFSHDPIQIGIIAIPGGVSQIVGGFILPALSHRIKHIKAQIIVALVIQTVFIALYSVALPSNKAAWMAFQFIGNGCFPLITLLCYITAGLHVNQRDLGIASGLIGTFRTAGGSVGNAIYSTILHGVVDGQLASRISAAALSLGYPANDLSLLIPAVIETGSGIPGAYATVPGVTPAIEAATAEAFREAYSYAFKRVFWSTIPFGVLAITAACFIRDPSKYLTNHVAVHLEKEVLGQPHLSSEHNTSAHEHQARIEENKAE